VPGRTCQDGCIIQQHPAAEEAGLLAGQLLEERHHEIKLASGHVFAVYNLQLDCLGALIVWHGIGEG
jgi:hypothetical protein